jgi:xanthine/CO dehydrogenase XdhC/CoxF family maturation factor
MILCEDGSTAGSISGGCLESELRRRVPEILAGKSPVLAEYDLSGSDDIVFGSGLGCGGRIGVMLTELDAAALAGLERAAESSPPAVLLLAGSGEDLLPLARIAKILGWDVEVVVPRVTPQAQRRWAPVLERPIRLMDEIESVVTPSTAVVVATHNYLDDLEILRAIVPTAARYIGLLGSRARVERLVEDASDVGSRAALSRLHGPAGLDVGGETPEEIALSIASEIQAVFSGHSGGPLRDRDAPIHNRVGQPVTHSPRARKQSHDRAAR